MSEPGARAIYALKLGWALDELASLVEALPSGDLDRRLAGETNSPATIAAHVGGAVRAWVLGIGCALPADRDRTREFATHGVPAAALARELRVLADECSAALAQLDPARLDERLTPSQALYGEGAPRALSRREAIVSALQHAGVHLGELRLTTDLLRRTADD
ncbi:MAG: DinB family protein [Dehalococcoidia bacterium]